MTPPRWLRGPHQMTETTFWLLAALGWLLMTWGLSVPVGWWVLPFGLGLGCLAVFVLYMGLVNLRDLVVLGRQGTKP